MQLNILPALIKSVMMVRQAAGMTLCWRKSLAAYMAAVM